MFITYSHYKSSKNGFITDRTSRKKKIRCALDNLLSKMMAEETYGKHNALSAIELSGSVKQSMGEGYLR